MYLESVRAMQKQLIFTEGGYTFLAESNNKKVITPNPSPYPSS